MIFILNLAFNFLKIQYDDHLNLEEVEEINKKFTEGTCKYDNPEDELLLGDPIDIKRIIRRLPTSQDYRKLI